MIESWQSRGGLVPRPRLLVLLPRLWFPLCGVVWSEILLILAEVQEDVAVLAVKGDEVAADEFDAGDVVAFRRERSGWIRLVRVTGDSLPGEDEVEGCVVVEMGMNILNGFVLERDLKLEDGGLDAGEAGLTPGEGSELVDGRLLDIGLGI